ncbi:BAIAP2 [Cervus elaphus hippelaphus]|uniref:BAIAP2 n=1 Tax=Cervus elaphus hippelaphus TaxID=46360 RepID=A0A212DAV3_CEREH|nr:BAIAP2 [Cervus elaphus hippelaphus]
MLFSALFQTIMEQFNPSLRNFIAMGKNYEKALAGVTYAAKGYFDALVKMGELASESQGSKELEPAHSRQQSTFRLFTPSCLGSWASPPQDFVVPSATPLSEDTVAQLAPPSQP